MSQSLMQMTRDLVLAMIQVGHVSSETLTPLLRTTHGILSELHTMEGREDHGSNPQTAASVRVNWRRSLTPAAVICLECDEKFKQLTSRHLRSHGLNGHSYRAKYGIPSSQSLMAGQSLARRREVAKQIRPWEQTARSRRARARQNEA